jgi:hypothetical protein
MLARPETRLAPEARRVFRALTKLRPPIFSVKRSDH